MGGGGGLMEKFASGMSHLPLPACSLQIHNSHLFSGSSLVALTTCERAKPACVILIVALPVCLCSQIATASDTQTKHTRNESHCELESN